MKSTAAGLAFSVLVVIAGESIACGPISHDARDDFADAQSIFVGYVTGNKHAGYEAHLLAGGDPNKGQIGDVLARVTPTEALKGAMPSQVIEVITDCMGTAPKAGARVVVVQKGGRSYLIEYSGFEHELRQVIQSRR